MINQGSSGLKYHDSSPIQINPEAGRKASNLNTRQQGLRLVGQARVRHTLRSGIKVAVIWQCSGTFPPNTAFDWKEEEEDEGEAAGVGGEEGLARVRRRRVHTPGQAGRCTCGAGRRDREGCRAWR